MSKKRKKPVDAQKIMLKQIMPYLRKPNIIVAARMDRVVVESGLDAYPTRRVTLVIEVEMGEHE